MRKLFVFAGLIAGFQRNGAVEHTGVFAVGRKVAHAHKLEVIARFGLGQAFLQLAVLVHDQAGRVKVIVVMLAGRRFMDMELSQLRPAYYYTLQRYNAALKQRNALLRPDIAKDAAELRKELYIWDEQLSRTGAEIMRMRAEFASRLSVIAGRLHKSISGERESLFVRYAPDVSVERLGGGDAQAALAEALYTGAMDDIRRGYTGSGPHRDELELSLNGANVRIYGSQGQQRTAALSLKLSELELIRAETGESPVLLLDDVLSELDEPRQRALLEAMSDCQTFLTCTTLEGLKRAGLRGINAWRCVDGTLERER